MDELDGTTDVAPQSSIKSVTLPFQDAADGAGCRELTKVLGHACV